MKYFEIENWPVHKETTSPEIYSIQIRTEDRMRYIVINHASFFPWSEWTVSDAVAYYLSPEGKADRDESYMKAYGFYD